MSIVVVHRQSGKRYVLLGTGFGIWGTTAPMSSLRVGAAESHVEFTRWGTVKTTEPAPVAPGEGPGERAVATVCDDAGNLLSFEQSELQVASIAGKPPSHFLSDGYR